MKNRPYLILILLLLAAFVLTGCAQDPAGAEMKKFVKTARAEEVETAEEAGSLILTASVTLPDYSRIFQEVLPEAEGNSTDTQSFQQELFDLALKAAKGEETVTKEVTLDLTRQDPQKTGWSRGDLQNLACTAAVQEELEEFALQIFLEQSAPRFDPALQQPEEAEPSEPAEETDPGTAASPEEVDPESLVGSGAIL